MGIYLFFNLITTNYDDYVHKVSSTSDLVEAAVVSRRISAVHFDPSLPSLDPVFDSQFCECLQLKSLRSQQNIFRNSLLKVRFIPAYIKGFIVWDKYIQKLERTFMLHGIDVKRLKTATTQNGIQHIMNANTTTNSDLLSLSSCTLMLEPVAPL